MSEHSDWCRQMMRTLAMGGVWGIPRSGLIFTKRAADTLALTARMPNDPAMPMTAEELVEYQDGDFEATKEEFAVAGFKVISEIEP
jgi:hypothetical protein